MPIFLPSPQAKHLGAMGHPLW
ncbi:MAG: hypothetical protein K0Q71_4127, partial [Thermomicrobiales bacterium]|nr:hypothetical protein [Thermomicrobiales bacterium]